MPELDYQAIYEFIKTHDGAFYFLLGVLTGLWLFRFIVKKLFLFISLFIIALLTGGGYSYFHFQKPLENENSPASLIENLKQYKEKDKKEEDKLSFNFSNKKNFIF